MAYEQKEGQGSLFRNDKTNDKQPDYTGSLMIGGTLYRVAGWVKEGSKGKYLSLKAEPKDANGGGQGAPIRQRAESPVSEKSEFNEENIPF